MIKIPFKLIISTDIIRIVIVIIIIIITDYNNSCNNNIDVNDNSNVVFVIAVK